MAHRHPDLPDYCTICDEPKRSASEWALLIVSGIVTSLALWALVFAVFAGLR